MRKQITESEYRQECEEIARDAFAEHPDDQGAQSDYIWETCGGHQWVIYTFYHFQILALSENSGYAVEEWGADMAVKDGTLNSAGLAFGAFYADTLAALEELEGDAEERQGD